MPATGKPLSHEHANNIDGNHHDDEHYREVAHDHLESGLLGGCVSAVSVMTAFHQSSNCEIRAWPSERVNSCTDFIGEWSFSAGIRGWRSPACAVLWP